MHLFILSTKTTPMQLLWFVSTYERTTGCETHSHQSACHFYGNKYFMHSTWINIESKPIICAYFHDMISSFFTNRIFVLRSTRFWPHRRVMRCVRLLLWFKVQSLPCVNYDYILFKEDEQKTAFFGECQCLFCFTLNWGERGMWSVHRLMLDDFSEREKRSQDMVISAMSCIHEHCN